LLDSHLYRALHNIGFEDDDNVDKTKQKIIMHSSTILMMARGKGKTVPIKLLSSAGTGFFYTTRKNVSNTQHKMAFVKYDPIVQRRVLFKEHKIK
jgi:large subunit ribosomal protein L33